MPEKQGSANDNQSDKCDNTERNSQIVTVMSVVDKNATFQDFKQVKIASSNRNIKREKMSEKKILATLSLNQDIFCIINHVFCFCAQKQLSLGRRKKVDRYRAQFVKSFLCEFSK